MRYSGWGRKTIHNVEMVKVHGFSRVSSVGWSNHNRPCQSGMGGSKSNSVNLWLGLGMVGISLINLSLVDFFCNLDGFLPS